MNIAGRVLHTVLPPLTPLMARAAELKAEGRTVFQLGQAVVDYEPPERFVEALVEGCRSHRFDGYAPDPGTLALRDALGGYLKRSFGIDVEPEREILVTPGANHAAYTALTVLLEPGDEAILISPYYFNHLMTTTLMGARANRVEAPAQRGFVPRVEDILAAWTSKTRALVMVNPSNPTGARYPDAWLRELGESLERDERWRNVWILSDQTYQEITFDGNRPLSPAALPVLRERTITLGSFSKSFALAGWRLGFLTAPVPFVTEALKVQDSSVICAAHAAQHALARTLQDENGYAPYLEEKRALLAKRRDALLKPFEKDERFDVHTPGGACFAFVGLPEGTDAERFTWDLLSVQGVVAVPGIPFGPGWKRFLRLSFGSGTEEALEEAGHRIVSHL